MLLDVKEMQKELSCYQNQWLRYCFTCGCDTILNKTGLRKKGLHPLLPTEGGRPSPEVMRMGQLALSPTPAAALGRADPAPRLGSVLELTLLAGMQVSRPGAQESRWTGLTQALSSAMWGHGWRKMPSLSSSLTTCGR